VVSKPTEEKILAESKEQIELAMSELNALDQLDVDSITSHFACHILLNNSIKNVMQLSRKGLIPESEATHLLEDLNEYVGSLLVCRKLQCRKVRKSDVETQGEIDLATPLLGSKGSV
jgi:hypothetical protein